MTEREVLKLALEALENLMYWDNGKPDYDEAREAITAIKKALSQPEQEPEFIKHEVENAEDWSEWVCPNPHKYLMKCCDCGLIHEAQFGVVRYKSETEREDCDFVDDPNLQAVFRMRRSEQWTPEDTAHRAGGLPMEQTEQEPVASLHDDGYWLAKKTAAGRALSDRLMFAGSPAIDVYTSPPQRKPQEFVCSTGLCHYRKPLTDDEAFDLIGQDYRMEEYAQAALQLIRKVEAAHGIKGEA